MDSDVSRNKALATAYIEASNRGDAAFIAEMYADDGTHVVAGHTPISGRYTKAQMQAAAGGIFAPFPNGIDFWIVSMVAEGDSVAIETASHGMHESGRLYSNEYHWIMRFRDGLLVETKEYLDTQMVSDILCGGAAATYPQPDSP